MSVGDSVKVGVKLGVGDGLGVSDGLGVREGVGAIVLVAKTNGMGVLVPGRVACNPAGEADSETELIARSAADTIKRSKLKARRIESLKLFLHKVAPAETRAGAQNRPKRGA